MTWNHWHAATQLSSQYEDDCDLTDDSRHSTVIWLSKWVVDVHITREHYNGMVVNLRRHRSSQIPLNTSFHASAWWYCGGKLFILAGRNVSVLMRATACVRMTWSSSWAVMVYMYLCTNHHPCRFGQHRVSQQFNACTNGSVAGKTRAQFCRAIYWWLRIFQLNKDGSVYSQTVH